MYYRDSIPEFDGIASGLRKLQNLSLSVYLKYENMNYCCSECS